VEVVAAAFCARLMYMLRSLAWLELRGLLRAKEIDEVDISVKYKEGASVVWSVVVFGECECV